MEEVKIHTATIQLDQFLKLAAAVHSGGQVKFLIADRKIKLNSEIVLERRKKLRHNDVVEIEGCGSWKVTVCFEPCV